MSKVTQERVRELFEYVDGDLIRRVACRGQRKGSVAGYREPRGYIQIQVGRGRYTAHRLIWLWHYGYLPEHGLDHKNRVKSDNRIKNLREVSSQCNIRNTGNRKDNTSGVKGVSWCEQRRKWAAQICVRGKSYNLGCYTAFINAACARLDAEQRENWKGCDSSSPVYLYVCEYILKGN